MTDFIRYTGTDPWQRQIVSQVNRALMDLDNRLRELEKGAGEEKKEE